MWVSMERKNCNIVLVVWLPWGLNFAYYSKTHLNIFNVVEKVSSVSYLFTMMIRHQSQLIVPRIFSYRSDVVSSLWLSVSLECYYVKFSLIHYGKSTETLYTVWKGPSSLYVGFASNLWFAPPSFFSKVGFRKEGVQW